MQQNSREKKSKEKVQSDEKVQVTSDDKSGMG